MPIIIHLALPQPVLERHDFLEKSFGDSKRFNRFALELLKEECMRQDWAKGQFPSVEK